MFCAILLDRGKHVLVEKMRHSRPRASGAPAFWRLKISPSRSTHRGVNHRFEPHYVRMYDLVRSGALDRIYHCRMFYGNGTVRLVRDSEWRDRPPSNSR